MRRYLSRQPAQATRPARQERPGAGSLRSLISQMGNQAALDEVGDMLAQDPPPACGGGQPLEKAMQARMERQFGLSLADVRVHRDSEEPAKFDAGAYTYGSDIFIGPGQEDTLEHELTHVAQQKLGQVRPTGQEYGMPINRDPALEHGADLGTVSPMAGGAAGPVVQCNPPKKGKGNPGEKSSAARPATQPRAAAAVAAETTASASTEDLLARIFLCRDEKVKAGKSSDERFQDFTRKGSKFLADNKKLLSHAFLGTDATRGEKTTDPVGVHAYLVDGVRNGRLLPDDVCPVYIIGDPRQVHVLLWKRRYPSKTGKTIMESRMKASTMFSALKSMEAAAGALLDDSYEGKEIVDRRGQTRYPIIVPETLGLDERALNLLLNNPEEFIRNLESLKKKFPLLENMVHTF